jgi:hypothetical protein
LRADSPRAYIAARLVADAPIMRIVLWLDGKELTPAMLGPDEQHLGLFYRPPGWRAGRHEVRIEVWDRTGAVAQATWRFWIDPGI